MSDDQLKSYTLAEIEKLLQSNGKILRDYPTLPFSNSIIIEEGKNRFIQDELCYDRINLAREHKTLLFSLNNEQRNIYQTIMNAVLRNEGGVFFVYGYGGTRKTFIWKTLSSALRLSSEIILTVASSGIASLLIPGGRTAHSRFCIPLIGTEDSTCNTKQGSQLAELLKKTRLIIWDEAPMVHKHCFEALNKTLRDVLKFTKSNSIDQPFGGKVIVFGGDFRQILSVIPKASRQDVIFATLNSFYLWSFCKVLTLTKNMRLQSRNLNSDIEELREFSDWILEVRDGTIGGANDGEADLEIPLQ